MISRIIKPLVFTAIILFLLLGVVELGIRLVVWSALEERKVTTGEGKFTVACHGDSWTYGLAMKPEQSYPAILESILDELTGNKSATRVINHGHPGFTTWDVLQSIQQTLVEDNPDLVIVFAGMNDGATIESMGSVPQNIMAVKNTPAHNQSNSEPGGGLQHFKLYRLLNRLLLPSRVHDVDTGNASSKEQIEVVISNISEKSLIEINNLLSKHEIPWLLVDYTLPCNHVVPRHLVGNDIIFFQHALKRMTLAMGIPLVETKGAFSKSNDEEVFHKMFYTHPNATGYRLIAMEVAKTILHEGWINLPDNPALLNSLDLDNLQTDKQQRIAVKDYMLESIFHRMASYTKEDDDSGKPLRVTADVDSDGHIDYWAEYKEGMLTQIKRAAYLEEHPENSRAMQRITFNDYEVVAEEYDHTGDGFYESKTVFPKDDIIQKFSDMDQDGSYEYTDIFRFARLVDRKVDSNRDGEYDLFFSITPEGVVESAHADLNMDGKDDYWEEYKHGQHVRSISDRNFDGNPDKWIFFDRASGKKKIEEDSDQDGKPDQFSEETL